jgi:hypothetical protein
MIDDNAELRGAGRPSKFCQEMLDKCYKYLSDYKELGDAVPSMVGLAKFVGVGRSTIYNWGQAAPEGWGIEEVADIITMVSEYQELDLINGGLKSEMNPAIVKMLLTRHGYADKVETDVTSAGQQLNTWTIQPVTTATDE